MPELSVEDVAAYTHGRLDAGDDETARLLAAALGAARRYCGWHVTPVHTDEEFTLDGPGSRLLVLPSLRLTALTALSEDGVDLDVDTDLEVSVRGLVRKSCGGYWTDKFNSVVVTIDHGYDDAADWQSAVLSLLDRWSYLSTGGQPTVVGPFQWPTRESAGEMFTGTERYVLDLYSLEHAP